MTTVNSNVISLIQQLQSLETQLSNNKASISPGLDSFVSALENVISAGQSILSANSAGQSSAVGKNYISSSPAATVTGPVNLTASTIKPTATISASTMSALLAADGAQTSPLSTSSAIKVGKAHLLPSGSMPDTVNKPSMAEFMAASGADASAASDVLYGTIGSNTDLRDWGAIMASKNPLADARASTGALYNSSLNYVSSNAVKPGAANVIETSGNFEYAKFDDNNKSSRLIITDGLGNQLTAPSDPQLLSQRALNFGFDTSALSTLETQLDSKNVQFRTGLWNSGF